MATALCGCRYMQLHVVCVHVKTGDNRLLPPSRRQSLVTRTSSSRLVVPLATRRSLSVRIRAMPCARAAVLSSGLWCPAMDEVVQGVVHHPKLKNAGAAAVVATHWVPVALVVGADCGYAPRSAFAAAACVAVIAAVVMRMGWFRLGSKPLMHFWTVRHCMNGRTSIAVLDACVM